ncbi:MAG: ribosomal-processing cysteine protease Prp [Acholeplasmatales bacterium]|nr:ribosomal-processing cysteine protease Prp [Acholeplasmatales bacterium]
MITYSIRKEKEDLVVEISGHSGYDDSGRDIVCATVSAMSITIVNAIDNLGYNVRDLEKRDGYLYFRVNSEPVVNKLIITLAEQMDSLEKTYPDFVTRTGGK